MDRGGDRRRRRGVPQRRRRPVPAHRAQPGLLLRRIRTGEEEGRRQP